MPDTEATTERLAGALRAAYMAFADKCDAFIEGEDMSAEAFLMAWKEEVEPRIREAVRPASPGSIEQLLRQYQGEHGTYLRSADESVEEDWATLAAWLAPRLASAPWPLIGAAHVWCALCRLSFEGDGCVGRLREHLEDAHG